MGHLMTSQGARRGDGGEGEDDTRRGNPVGKGGRGVRKRAGQLVLYLRRYVHFKMMPEDGSSWWAWEIHSWRSL